MKGHTNRLQAKLRERLKCFFEQRCEWYPSLEAEIPAKWQRHGDLLLFPCTAFSSSIWEKYGNEVWKIVAQCFSCKRLGKIGTIYDNDYRSPQVVLLLGEDTWVTHKENHIRYTFDVRQCMFSSGNVTERMRVAKFECKGETVVDLFAGVGYFTLPLLVHADAAHVHACEWNPNAIEALRRNLSLNSVAGRCTVYEGDNKLVCPHDSADRVILGLIPTSDQSWQVACAALKSSTGGMLHIHGNVTSGILPSQPMSERSNACTAKQSSSLSQKNCQTCCDCKCEYKCFCKSDCCSSYKVETDCHAVTAEEDLGIATVACKGRCYQNSGASTNINNAWTYWANSTAAKISHLLTETHGGIWKTEVKEIVRVKSYAPHIDHLVVDLYCKPIR